MSILGFIILGLIAGALARLLVPGKDPMGILGTILLGVVGSLLGGFLADALFNDESIGLIGAVLGSVAVLLIYRAVVGRRGHSTV
jgi:uncharacterized membrane protein YeaQ/YmgE (transglycosylase-associated protein family)